MLFKIYVLIWYSIIAQFHGCGRIAQLGEHSPYKAGVTGSSPVPPTIKTATNLGLSTVK